jgi:uncharacterized membrane protein
VISLQKKHDMEYLPLLHKANLIIHISSGSLALLLGTFILLTRKSGPLHRNSGRIFLLLLGIVVFTGLFGALVFKLNSFLLVITFLSGYMGFSGFRSIRKRSNIPATLDVLMAILGLLAVSLFIWYFKVVGMMWSPVIIYSTLGYLGMAAGYDLLRYLFSKAFYGRLWLYEHILKMISTFSALLSAFSGTVLPKFHPYSQFLPSVFGGLLAVAFIAAAIYQTSRKQKLSLSEENASTS